MQTDLRLIQARDIATAGLTELSDPGRLGWHYPELCETRAAEWTNLGRQLAAQPVAAHLRDGCNALAEAFLDLAQAARRHGGEQQRALLTTGQPLPLLPSDPICEDPDEDGLPLSEIFPEVKARVIPLHRSPR